MTSVISLQGIRDAVGHLPYRNTESLKRRLVRCIVALHEQSCPPDIQESAVADALIRNLWGEGVGLRALPNKRRNLSSLRSSVNSDLRDLYRQGRNPEGLIIGPNYLFAMSEEAKEALLATFSATVGRGAGVSLETLTQVIQTVGEVLSASGVFSEEASASEREKMERVRELLRDLSHRLSGDGKDAEGHGDDMEPPAEGVEGPLSEEPATDADERDDVIEEVIEVLEEEDDTLAGEPLPELEALDTDTYESEPETDPAPLEADAADVDGPLDEVIEVLEADDAMLGEEPLQETETEPIFSDGDAADTQDLLEEVIEVVEEDDDGPVDEASPDVGQDTGTEDLGLPVGNLGVDEAGGALTGGSGEKTRILAEEFDGYLGAMERHFNQYILVPEGDYPVGADRPEGSHRPAQRVYLKGFYAGKFPVTNGLFEIFVEKTGYVTSAEKAGYGLVFTGSLQESLDAHTGRMRLTLKPEAHCERVPGAFWYQPEGPGSTLHGRRTHPVVQVSRMDAMAFAAWTGKRLPTEDEWEAAARTEQGLFLPWGIDWSGDRCNVEEALVGGTTPVDRYSAFANPWGIADTLGNVFEWTLSPYPEDPGAPKTAPCYVVKGGSWLSDGNVRLFSRFKMEAETASNTLGFRCVAY